MKQLLAFLLLASCDAGTPPKQPVAPPAAPPLASPAPAGSSSGGSATPVTGQAKVSISNCVEDKQARAACVAKGDRWQYSDPPPRNCSGVERPEPVKASPPPPCECIKTADYQQQVIECSQVP